MKHFTENNQYEKSISNEMLNFCSLCVAEVYALRCDAMRAGTFFLDKIDSRFAADSAVFIRPYA